MAYQLGHSSTSFCRSTNSPQFTVQTPLLCSSQLLPSATWLRQGSAFTPVCQSFCSLFTGGFVQTPPGQTPRGRHPPGETPPGQTPPPPRADSPLRRLLHRTVRILLECYLVTNFFLTIIFRQDLWTISRTGEDFY